MVNDTGTVHRPACDRMIVAQLGARMHYGVPRILAGAGRLERLYTDICGVKGWPRLLGLLPKSALPARLHRLADRIPQGLAPESITAFTSFGLEYARRLARARDTDERNAAFLWAGPEFCRRVIAQGFGQARSVYVFNSAGLELLLEARQRGVSGVLEQTIAPRRIEWKILSEEQARFPEWEAAAQAGLMTDYCDRESAEWAAADLIVCASDFVRDGIVACGGSAAKCVVVPYGIERVAASARPARRPGPLRVLTVGAVGLRKGSPYVLEAARRLAGRVEFRMVGAVDVLPGAERELRRHVELVGVVPRSQIQSQYDWADVFLLPSLCEGSATVTYEALFQGLPVICTRETGSVIQDKVDGFLIPARDPSAIAERLEHLASCDDLLSRMSRNARTSSASCTLANYGRNLVAAFEASGCLRPDV